MKAGTKYSLWSRRVPIVITLLCGQAKLSGFCGVVPLTKGVQQQPSVEHGGRRRKPYQQKSRYDCQNTLCIKRRLYKHSVQILTSFMKDFTYQMGPSVTHPLSKYHTKHTCPPQRKIFLCNFHPLTHYTWHNSCYHSRSDWWMKACDYLVMHIKPYACCFLESHFINGEVDMVKDSLIYRLSIPPSQLWKESLGGFHRWYSANIGVTGGFGSSVCPPGTLNHLVLASSTHTLMIILWWTLVASPH